MQSAQSVGVISETKRQMKNRLLKCIPSIFSSAILGAEWYEEERAVVLQVLLY